ncbi:MAG: sugar porter family MFS transporter [Verrucomicrobiota bacterium JB025]|nr:sugar porter family MFS transporter [Verrucomicrobiota bacterium JB025]
MQGRLIRWAVTAALAGFLFGFDTVVISGAEKTIQELWSLRPAVHGLAMSMALWGTVAGSLVGSIPTDLFGRRKTLLSIGILYFVSAVWSGLATDATSFMIARFIGGLGVGISTVVAPLFISEISPAQYRGRLAGMFQFNIVFGILIAFVSNSLIGGIGENAWRWMLGVEAIPALIYSLMCFSLPESPRWLIGRKGDRATAAGVLQKIHPEMTGEQITAKVDEIANAATEAQKSPGSLGKRLRLPILLALLIAFFNQLSGINAILYFAPRIFELTGLGAKAALLQSVGIGVTNLIFTFVGLWLIDRLGRRTLLYIGSFGYIASLGLCAWAFFTYAPQFNVATRSIELSTAVGKMTAAEGAAGYTDKDRAALRESYESARNAWLAATADEKYLGGPVTLPAGATSEFVDQLAKSTLQTAAQYTGAGSKLVLFCIFAFIAAHAVGQGAVIWVFISEIFPNRQRALGQSLGSFTHWIFAALLTLCFPIAITSFPPGYVFGFFCFMMVLQLVWVKLMVPETKGRALEQLEHGLVETPT